MTFPAGPPAAIAISCAGPTGPTGPAGPGGSGTPAGPTGAVQFNLDNVNLGGATGASIAADGALVVGLESTTPVPVTGDMRYIGGPLDAGGFIARFRSGRTLPINEQDIGFYYCYSTTASDFTGETTVIGRGGWNDGSFPLVYQPTLCPDEIIDAANGGYEFLFTTPNPDNEQNGLFAFQVDRPADPVGSFPFARLFLVQRYVNLMLYPVNFAAIENALGHGEGVVVWGKAQVVPTTNPFAGQIIAYVDPTETAPYFRDPAGAVVPMFAKSADGRLTTDQSTSSASYADLITASLTCESTVVDVTATAVCIPNGGNGFFRLAVDGSPVVHTSAFIPNQVDPENIAIVARVSGLSAGAHTFSLQWATSSGTLSCNVTSQPTIYQANILVRASS